MVDAATEGQGQESSSLLGVLRDCVTSAVIAVDKRQRVCAFSEQAERLTGLHANEVLGQPTAALPADIRAAIADCLRTGQTVTLSNVSLNSSAKPRPLM